MARHIPPQKVDEIYTAADIVEVVGEFVQLKKRGSNYFGLSPWTTEKSPSFTVAPAKNIFKDFSSGRGGNAVTFLMELEGMTYVEALEWLAKKYNIELAVEDRPFERNEEDKRDSLYILNGFAERWFQQQLRETDEGKRNGITYFQERGLLDSTLYAFGLGYAPASWDALVQEGLKQQYSEDILVEAGLAFRSDKDGRVLDRYRERIIFPLHNQMGKVLGFAGRILTKKEGVAKYVNSPETPVYQKGKVLYGLNQNKIAIRDADSALLVEGYMDLISLYQNGIRNVVASSGTALTVEQIRLLRRFTSNVLLVYDADAAGIRAALRGVDLLLENELKVKVLVLPEGHDPDSFVQAMGQKGFEDFRAAHTQDFIEFKIDALSKEYNMQDPAQRAEVIHETATTLAKIPDAVLQGLYIGVTAEKLGVPLNLVESAMRRAFGEKLKQDKRDERFEENRRKREHEGESLLPDKPSSAIGTQERELLRLIVNYSGELVKPYEDEAPLPLADYLFMELEDVNMDEASLENMRLLVEKNFKEYKTVKVDRLYDLCDEIQRNLLTQLLTVPEAVSQNWEQYDIRVPKMDENLLGSADSALAHFSLRKIKNLLRKNQQEIKTETDSAKLEELLQTQVYLLQKKRELSLNMGIVISE